MDNERRSHFKKLFGILGVMLIAFGSGLAIMWLAMIDTVDLARNEGRQQERAAILCTLVKCARTGNLYQFAGSDLIVEPKIRPQGLMIVDVKTGRIRAEQAGQ